MSNTQYKTIIELLNEPISQWPGDEDEAMWNRVVQERHTAAAMLEEFSQVTQWMLALIDGGEEMPKPDDDVAGLMRNALQNLHGKVF